ncbi:linear amide C-N hydrolase [Flavobacterium collinsii]|uniref:linear amide C-N hydrolase n=1 Tax=Flavobacterium collinsii TaxID=1114861 RepID=UPI0021E0F578|nr:linear amide C-N hydrolase [Flavobacterium collinsii]
MIIQLNRFPRGIERNGEAGNNSVKWRSKYGSVITSSWDIAYSDGMNEKGLVSNLLWLAEPDFPKLKKTEFKKGLVVSLWAQYTLDNFVNSSRSSGFI